MGERYRPLGLNSSNSLQQIVSLCWYPLCSVFHYNARPLLQAIPNADWRDNHDRPLGGYLRTPENNMRFNLKVPFAEKDKAKKLGARWDATLKVWYVLGDADATPFAQWSPVPHEGAAAAKPSVPGGGAARQQASGKVFIGSAFVDIERLCDCLPWDVCGKCEPTSLQKRD